MCFNEKVSFLVGSFGIISSLFLIIRGNRINNKEDILSGVLLFFISLMQYIEYVLWRNQTCNWQNQVASILIIVVLLFQVLSTYITHHLLFKSLFKNTNRFILLIIFSLLCLYSIKILFDNKNKICSFKDKDSCRLTWEPFRFLIENNSILFTTIFCLYLYLFYIIRDSKTFGKKYLFQISFLFAIIYSIFYKGKYFLTIFGGVWCFLCVAYAIVSIFNL